MKVEIVASGHQPIHFFSSPSFLSITFFLFFPFFKPQLKEIVQSTFFSFLPAAATKLSAACPFFPKPFFFFPLLPFLFGLFV